jgi:hypothetical protein
MMPKVLIYLAVWKRPEITEICFMGLERMRKNFGIKSFAVISELSMRPLCKKYRVDYCIHDNDPLGRKKNFGLQVAMKRHSFDYIIEIGSDDLLKNEIIETYPWSYSFMGLKSFIQMNSIDGESRKWSLADGGFGIGRAIHRSVLEAMRNEYGILQLWPDHYNKRLDGSSVMKMAIEGVGQRTFDSAEPLAIDIKSETNIWPFNKDAGEPYEFAKAISGLSYPEMCAIKALQHAAV